MLRSRLLGILSLVVAVLGLTAGACGRQPDRQTGGGGETGELTTVRVATLPTGSMAPLHLGIKKGFFREAGLKVETTVAQGGAAMIPGLLNGEFDVAYGNPVSLMLARGKGLPIRIIAEGSQAGSGEATSINALMVAPDSGIDSVEDLAGKKFAVTTLENSGEVTIKAALEENGVPISDLEFVEIPFPEMNAALERGTVDAAWTTEPFITMGEKQGFTSVIDPMIATMPSLTLASYFATDEYISQNPDAVTSFRSAVGRAARYAEGHPEEVRQILSEFLETPPDVLNSMQLSNWSDEVNVESIRRQYELALKYGVLQQEFDLERMLPKASGQGEG